MAYTSNRRVLLASRPQGAPSPANFRVEEAAVPVPGEGQVLLHNLYLSLDPYMRGRMNDGPSYAEPFKIGEPMGGATVSKWVFESKVKGTEDFTDGLENAAKAFIGMLEGKNFASLLCALPRIIKR